MLLNEEVEMKKYTGFMGLMCLMFFMTTEAGWFGPSNYDECILENMEGVNSDLAAKAVIHSCRDKFPLPELEVKQLPNEVLKKLQAKGVSIWKDGNFRANIGNGDSEWTISSLVIRITDKDTKKYRDYAVQIKSAYLLTDQDGISPYSVQVDKMHPLPPSLLSTLQIRPQEWSGVEFEIFEKPESWSWSIVSGEGYRE